MIAAGIRSTHRKAPRAQSKRLVLFVTCALGMLIKSALADAVRVRHPQGWAHGYVEVTTLEGHRIGVGDLVQRVSKGVVTSRLVLNFFDSSVDDETTIYTQDRALRLLTDHHIQHGPSFPKPADVFIDAVHGMVRNKDKSGKVSEAHVEMPADLYNGLASGVLMNVPAGTHETTIAIIIGEAKPRIAHLKSVLTGKKPFTLGGVRREASEWTVHVELGGIAKVVAPIIGRQPQDYHVLIGGGEDPVFIREEGPLFESGPIWRVQQVSAVVAE